MSGSGQAHPKEHLSSYLDDQLTLETRAAVDRHLALCEECRADVDALRRLARAVRDEEPPPVPLDLSGRSYIFARFFSRTRAESLPSTRNLLQCLERRCSRSTQPR